MRSWIYIGAIVVIAWVLIATGMVGGAACMRGVGCVYTSEGGIATGDHKAVELTAD